MSFTEHRYTSFDGLSLHYRVYGEGSDVVLCLPGLTRNSLDFEGIALHLAPDWRVVTPDLRGRGRSDWDPNWRQYRPEVYVRDIWTLMDQLGIDRWVNIGTSLGGLMSMIMAKEAPQRLRGVILNDVGPEVTREALNRIATYVGATGVQPDWTAAARMAKKNYFMAFPEADDSFWEAQARAAWREREDGQLDPAYDPAIGTALRKGMKVARLIACLQRFGLRREGPIVEFWDDFDHLTMPCLLLRGELSDVLSREIVDRMQERKPELEVVTVPGRGHVPTLTEPESTSAIDAFLAQL